MSLVGRVPDNRNANESDIGRLLFFPFAEDGVKVIAVRTSVPEDFRYLDLVRGAARALTGGQASVVLAFFVLPVRPGSIAGRLLRFRQFDLYCLLNVVSDVGILTNGMADVARKLNKSGFKLPNSIY